MPAEHRQLIAACGLGTLFEWYDFYLYGALAPVLARQFFAALDAGAALSPLLGFAVGFVVRPLGALVFGRLGDLIGRKYTFLATLLLMGEATFLIGLLPGHELLGAAAPAALIGLRLLQGLAIGGEYGGVATYVAEHAPQRAPRRLPGGSGDRHRGPAARAAHDRRHARGARRSVLRRLGLAHPVPALGGAGRDQRVDPAAAEGVAGVSPHQAGRPLLAPLTEAFGSWESSRSS